MIINRAGGCKIAAKKPNFDQSRGQLTTQPVSVHRKPAVSEPSWSRGPTLFGGDEEGCLFLAFSRSRAEGLKVLRQIYIIGGLL